MTKQMLTDDEILEQAIQVVDKRVHATAAMRQLFDAEVARPPRRLSAKAWRRAAVRQAGGDDAPAAAVRAVVLERGVQFPTLAKYIDGVTALIREGQWRGIPDELAAPPAIASANVVEAGSEIAQTGTGANLWHGILVAIDDLVQSNPAIYGSVDDPTEEAAQRAAVKDHADEALRTLAAVPQALLLGVALERGVPVEPRSTIAARLVEHAMAGSPRPAPGRPSPRPEGATLVIGRA